MFKIVKFEQNFTFHTQRSRKEPYLNFCPCMSRVQNVFFIFKLSYVLRKSSKTCVILIAFHRETGAMISMTLVTLLHTYEKRCKITWIQTLIWFRVWYTHFRIVNARRDCFKNVDVYYINIYRLRVFSLSPDVQVTEQILRFYDSFIGSEKRIWTFDHRKGLLVWHRVCCWLSHTISITAIVVDKEIPPCSKTETRILQRL